MSINATVKKVVEHTKEADGTYNTVYRKTTSDLVECTGGTNLQAALDAGGAALKINTLVNSAGACTTKGTSLNVRNASDTGYVDVNCGTVVASGDLYTGGGRVRSNGTNLILHGETIYARNKADTDVVKIICRDVETTMDVKVGGQFKIGAGAVTQVATQKIETYPSYGENFCSIFGVYDSMWTFGSGWAGTISLGTPGRYFNNIYALNNVTVVSDRNEKNNIVPLDESSKEFIMGLNPVSYKLDKGTSDRTHYGLIAQDVEDLMISLDMTSQDFGGLIKSEKYSEDIRDENNKLIEEGKVIQGEYRYALRYEEFIAPMIKTIQTQQTEIDLLKESLKTMNDRLSALEAK